MKKNKINLKIQKRCTIFYNYITILFLVKILLKKPYFESLTDFDEDQKHTFPFIKVEVDNSSLAEVFFP